jgi:hypothetical protein
MYLGNRIFLLVASCFLGIAGPKVQTQANQEDHNEQTNPNDGLLNKIKKVIFG